MIRLHQFCFPHDETIRSEGDENDVVHRSKMPDDSGVRQAETRRARPVWPNSSGLWLDSTAVQSSPNPLISNQTCSGRMVQSNHEAL